MTGAALSEIGGPLVFASTQSVFTVPINTQVYYDYDLVIRNSDGASTITGGLNGEPSQFNLYVRGPFETVPIYIYSVAIYGAAYAGSPTSRVWAKTESGRTIHHKTYSITNTYSFDWRQRDRNRIVPSAFCISVPPAYALAYTGGRLFAGNIYDAAASIRQNGDLYFSEYKRWNRMQSIVESSRSGGRNEYSGEQIQKIVPSSAGAQSAVYTHVFTNRELKLLGGSGVLGGNAANAEDLSISYTVAKKGTNSHRSIVEIDGSLFWLDQFGQFERLQDGRLVNLSRLSVDDKPKNVPASMRASVFGLFVKDTYIAAYSPSGGTKNSRLLGFHNLMEVWEFDDLLPAPCTAERMVLWFDSTSNGSGQRLLMGASNGKLYEYDIEGAKDLDDDIDVRITSREFVAQGNKSLRIGGVWMSTTGQNQVWTFDRVYRQQEGLSRSQANLTEGRVWDGGRPEVVSGFDDGRGERGIGAYLDAYGTLSAGAPIEFLGIELVEEAGDDATDGSI